MIARRPIVLFLLLGLSLVNASAQDGSRFFQWAIHDAGTIISRTDGKTVLIGLGAVAALAALSPLDAPIRDAARDVGPGVENYTDAMNQLGEPIVAIATTTGLFGISLLSKDARFQDAAFTSLQALAYAMVTTAVLKLMVGRYRPEDVTSSYRFAPFSGHDSFPSGHATAAFAILTPLAMYYNHPVSWALLAVMGGGTALARIVKNKHWATDTLAGSFIGFGTGYLLSRLHRSKNPQNVMPLRTFATPREAGVSMNIRF